MIVDELVLQEVLRLWRFDLAWNAAQLLQVGPTAAGSIIIVAVRFTGLLFLDFLFQFFGSHERLSTGPDGLQQLVFEVVVPLPASHGHLLERLMILVEEELRQLAHVPAVLELGGCDLGSLSEVAVLVQYLMDFILDLGFQVELFQEPRNHLAYFLGLGVFGSNYFILNGLLDGPEDVRVLDVFENELAFLFV